MSALMATTMLMADEVQKSGNSVTIRPDGGQAKVIRLEVINDNIIRVRATSKEALPDKPASLMIVPQAAPPKDIDIDDEDDKVTVKAKNVKAVVDTETGGITFFDADGKELLKEAKDGKQFWDFTVPERELGMKTGYTVPEAQKHGLTWQMKFDSPDDEAFYGLGQHQSEEFNMKGKNEDLFQYNTKVSIPFVLSNKNYGLLWDSYSYCRFGNPNDYLQLNRAFKLYDRTGKEGHLTGTYVDRQGKKLVRDEDSIYYEYGTPAKSEIALKTDNGGIKNFPKGINLMGATVTYEGFIEPECCGKCTGKSQSYQFILYYSGYVKVYLDGKEVVPERWRTAWNPNTYKFTADVRKGVKNHLRIEWQPDGGEAYCGLRVAEPRSESVDSFLSGARWPRIWTITSSLVRTSIRSSLAIAPSPVRPAFILSGCWASGRVVSAIRPLGRLKAHWLSSASVISPSTILFRTGTTGPRTSGAAISSRPRAIRIRSRCSTTSTRCMAAS